MAKLKGGTRIYGDVKIDGGIYDSSNVVGAGGSVLISTGTGIAWTSASLTGGGGITIYSVASSSQISNPQTGDLWVDTDTGKTYTYYNDGDSNQWVELGPNPTGPTGSQGIQGIQGVQGLQGLQGIQGVQGGVLATIPQNSQTANYTLVASDAGKHISITTGGVNVPVSVFSPGDTITIFNNSTGSQTITQNANVTLRFAGTTSTGSRTLASYGICSILCIVGGATPTFVISGAGLT